MKRAWRTVAVLAAAAILAVGCAGEPPVREVALYSIEDFLGTTSYSGASFSPDKSKLLVRMGIDLGDVEVGDGGGEVGEGCVVDGAAHQVWEDLDEGRLCDPGDLFRLRESADE